MDSLKLSICVFTYNLEKFLPKALDSIFEQEHNYPYEIVIGDDGSFDGTQKIIKDYQKKHPSIIKPILHKQNVGISKNYMQAIRSCQGEYIALLDGDDYWTDPFKLERQISFLDIHSEFVLSCHRYHRQLLDTQTIEQDPNEALFKDHPDGFAFDQESYFDQWLTPTFSVVFRNAALDNTPQLERFKYCWDTEIYWTILSKGKGFVHNFFGGVYMVHSQGHWNGENQIQQNAITYLIVEELYNHEPHKDFLKKTLSIFHSNIRFRACHKAPLLNISKLKNRNFTLISDDGWGGEVYAAFNLKPLTPFVGTYVFTPDYLIMIQDLKYYLSLPIQFISKAESRNKERFTPQHEHSYPIGRLENDVEIHFVDYPSEKEASQQWKNGIQKINWNNLFIKIDVSRTEDLEKSINLFYKTENSFKDRACFFNGFREKEIQSHPNRKDICVINNWIPDPKALFHISLASFDLFSWLNRHSLSSNMRDIFDATQIKRDDYLLRFDDYHFIQFTTDNISKLKVSQSPEAYLTSFSENIGCALIQYNKSNIEEFYLEVEDQVPQDNRDDVLIDARNPLSRHIFILTRGNPNHSLQIDLISRDHIENYEGVRLSLTGLEQSLPEEFAWIHFDFSIHTDPSTEDLFSKIKGFNFCINPGHDAKGSLEILAFFIGPKVMLDHIIESQD